MSGDEIAKLVTMAGANLLRLASDLIGANKELSAHIQEQMVKELALADSFLRQGGAMDRAFADADKKLDDKIAAAAGVETDPKP